MSIENRQSGLPIGDGQRDEREAVATGDRRDEMRYEDDPAQLARVRHTFHSDALPPDTDGPEHDGPDLVDVTDAMEVKPSPSVWDARPSES
jgi:hypothetical protein